MSSTQVSEISQASSASKVFRLMGLPMELRQLIYTHAVSPSCAEYADAMEVLDFSDGSWDFCFPLRDTRLPAFALTNKQIFYEYLDTYFANRTFRIGITVDAVAGWTKPDLSPGLKAWLGRLQASPLTPKCRIRHLTLRVHKAEQTIGTSTINATIDADYVGKSVLKYHTSLRFDETFGTPWQEGRDLVIAAYDLFYDKLKSFAIQNGETLPGLSWPQVQVLLRCIDVNPGTRGKHLDEDSMNWDEESDYEVEDWQDQGRDMEWIDVSFASRHDVGQGRWAKDETGAIGYCEGDLWQPEPEEEQDRQGEIENIDVLSEDVQSQTPHEHEQDTIMTLY